MNANTKYIEVNKGYAVIRLDNVGEDTLVTVYNVNVKDIDLLIEKLQAVKEQFEPKANIITDEPPQMTAVLGKKPESTDWYKNALSKADANAKLNEMPKVEKLSDPEPVMPKPTRGSNIINVIGVTSKTHKQHGHTYGGTKNMNENADIVKGLYIRIYGISENRVRWDKELNKQITYRVAYDKTFKIGDTVEYDSYNFAYTGKITAIGEKTVKIEHNHGGKCTQLSLHDFIFRNWDLNLEKIAEERANWYD